MAKKTEMVRHRAPSVPKRKYEMVVAAKAAVAKRAREGVAKRVGVLVGTVAAGAAGYVERNKTLGARYTSPVAMGVAGVVLAFVAPEMAKGKVGQAAAEAGAGLLAVAVYKASLGQPMIGEDDSVEGEGWE